MKKLITFVFLFSFFAAGIVWAQAAQTPTASSSNTSQTMTSTAGQTSSTNSQTASTSTAQGQAQASNGTYAGVSQAGMNALGGRKSSDLSPAEWNALSEKDRTAILAEERIQDVMKQEEVSREEAQKLIGEHDQTVAENIEKNKAAVNCSKGDSKFTRFLLNYVGNGGGDFCWFCPMFEGLFDAMNNLATAISVKMADVFLMIMGVGLLFSIAFKVAKMVVSLQGADLMQFLTDMFKHLGRAIIATALLVSSLSIFTYLVSPVLTMSMSLSSVIMDEGGGRGAVIKATQATGIKAASICDDLADQMKVSTTVEKQTKAFTPEVRASFLCALRTMSAGLIFGIILGVVIYSLAFTNMIWGVLPNIQYALLGLIIVIGHLAILITFPFKLIDSMIRMAFVTALMPLWIILWVFPATVGYTKKAWDLFLSSCLIFICLAVIITMVMSIMQYAIPNREEIIGLLTCGFDQQAADKIPIGGKELLVTAALTFLGWKMLGTATTLASSFVGAIPDLGLGQAMNETTVKGAKLAGKGARTGGRMVANSKVGQWAGRKLHMNSQRAATLGTLAATGVATAGAAPVLYGLGKGTMAGYRAVRNYFSGRGGAKGGTENTPNTPMPDGTQGGAPNTPTGTPQGGAPTTPTPNVPPQGGTPATPTGTPQEGAPNVLPQGRTPATPAGTPQGGTPNTPTPNVLPQGTPRGGMPAASTSSGAGTPSETMSFNAGGQPAEETMGASRTSQGGTLTGSTGSAENMSYTHPTTSESDGFKASRFGGSGSTSTTTGSAAVNENWSGASMDGVYVTDPKIGTQYHSDGGIKIPTGGATGYYSDGDKGSANEMGGSGTSTGGTGGQSGSNEGSSGQNQGASGSHKESGVDQVARDMARKASDDAQRAAIQSSSAQAAASQAMSEASQKDKDDDKKNKPE